MIASPVTSVSGHDLSISPRLCKWSFEPTLKTTFGSIQSFSAHFWPFTLIVPNLGMVLRGRSHQVLRRSEAGICISN